MTIFLTGRKGKMDSRKKIISATKALLEEKNFNYVTVQNIIDKAGVSRTGFYQNFASKYDAANAFYEEYVTNNILCGFNGSNAREIYLKIYDFIAKNNKYFLHAIKAEGNDAFYEFLYRYTIASFTDTVKNNTGCDSLSEELEFKLTVVARQQVFFIKKWVTEGCRIPSDKAAKWALEITPKEFINY